MDNYEYSPQGLKIIVDIANKHKIPISLGNDSITVHSKLDFKPLLKFSVNGFSLLVGFGFDSLNYYQEIIDDSKIFMQEKADINV